MKRSKRSGKLTAILAVCVVALGTTVYATGWADTLGESFAAATFALSPNTVSFSRSATTTDSNSNPPEKPVVKHLPTPVPLKAIYMTQCVAGTPTFRESVVKLIDDTELNAVVIDIRDYSGGIAFPTDDPLLKDMISDTCGARDMKAFVERLHEKGIYVIGRITVFQNPYYTKLHPEEAVQKKGGGVWKDRKGLAFVDVGSKPYWETVVALGKASYEIGFDELNFDYIRFPSDGPMNDIAFIWSGNRKKQDVLEDFFRYLHEKLHPLGIVTSADIFGMTTTNVNDLNIGQVLEKVSPYFDYVAPMVYPSHYPPQFNGWADPNAHPYDVVKYSMDQAVRRFLATTTVVVLNGVEPLASTTPPLYPKKPWNVEKLRPWLQDFDYGGNYDIAEVKAQITAVYDAGLTSWMLWAPSNRYTKGALLPE